MRLPRARSVLPDTSRTCETAHRSSIDAPSPGWARELHGFGWLRNLARPASAKAKDSARDLVREWIDRRNGHVALAGEPAVMGRRIMSWIANADLLLEGVPQPTYDRIADSLAEQIIRLSAVWRDAPAGYPRLEALIALCYGDLCIAGHERRLAGVEALLTTDLDQQILDDGGHISRNPSVLVDLLMDLLPLRRCFLLRERPFPPRIEAEIARMQAYLRYIRLGDGALPRFNGVSASTVDALAIVVAYDDPDTLSLDTASQSGYVRLARGDLVLIADVGSPPALEYAGQAHAGCLSFEMSVGPHLLIINGGAPGPAEQPRLAAARATASHSTLCLGGASSSELTQNKLLAKLAGGDPIRLPNGVRSAVRTSDGEVVLEASHDGYLSRFGLMHRRTITMSGEGTSLAGVDQLWGPERHAAADAGRALRGAFPPPSRHALRSRRRQVCLAHPAR